MLDDLHEVYGDVQEMMTGLRQLAQAVPIPPAAWVLGGATVIQVQHPLLTATPAPSSEPPAAGAPSCFLVLEDAAQQVQFIIKTQKHTTFLAIEVNPAYQQVFTNQEIQVIWSAGDPASERILCRGRIVDGGVSWKLAENITGWQSLRCELVPGLGELHERLCVAV